MKAIALAFAVCLSSALLLSTPARADDAALAEAFAWIKKCDGSITKPKYANLTLEQLPALTELQIGGHRKTDKKHLFVPADEFKHLAALPKLTKLHLGENDGLTEEAMAHVGKLTNLKELILWDAPMPDAALKHIVGLKNLTSLDLAFATQITTAALAYIVQLPNLENLTIPGTKIDDVAPLAKAPKLVMLKVGKLAPRGIEELKRAKPKLEIK